MRLQLSGMPLIPCTYLTEIEQYLAKRTWSQRLFSRPWRPWKAEEIRERVVPQKELYKVRQDGREQIFAHPHTISEIGRYMESQDNEVSLDEARGYLNAL